MRPKLTDRKPRVFHRWPFDRELIVLPVQTRDGGPSGLICRNLSSDGVCAIGLNQAPVGLQVLVTLPELTGGVRAVHAEVVRCEKLTSTGFNWCMRFAEPIDVSRYVAKDILSNEFVHELVAPHMIRGRIAVVSESAHDRALFNVTLRESPCVLTTHTDLERVLFDATRLDVVVLAAELQRPVTCDAMIQLLMADCKANFMLLAGDRSPATRKLATMLPFRAALVRPCTQQMVLSALAECLGIIARDDAQRKDQDAAAA